MKFIRANMSDQTITEENVPNNYIGLGGRGLTSIMINNEVPPQCDPLGPDNKLIFAPGLLSGTTLVNTSRVSIGAKSPLTGGIKESNVGGTMGFSLGKLGINAIIVEGKAPQGELKFLKIDDQGKASFVQAQDYKSMRTYELVEKIHKNFGKKNSILCIGPAGEQEFKVASIQGSDTEGRPCRAAGRGGLGAVMGAKGLKALIVDQGGKNPDPVADPGTFKESSKVLTKIINEDPFSGNMLPNFGTPVLVAPVNSLGAFPSFNARKGVFDGWEKISGEAMAEIQGPRGGKMKHMGCTQCIVHCSNEYVDEDGKYITSALEYETIWAMGGMTGIDHLDTIAKLDFLCDDIGVDTMSTGVGIAVAMDSGYKSFGDRDAAIEMVEEIAKGTEFGKILGQGPVAVGKHFNNERVPAVKGQSIAAYDPRSMIGNGITYATTPMGGDHTAGNLVGAYLGQVLDPLKKEGQIETSREIQFFNAAADSVGMCLMVYASLNSPEAREVFLNVTNAKLGPELAVEDLRSLGERILKAEREFNHKAGFTKNDDRLPKFFYEEPLPPHNTVFPFSNDELDMMFDF
ncbi:MAG: aldehyde ferredoxin oxidoreductase [Deltaproteobacteria bacterium]|nr:aldehyde ferredoxin oxidoreductase [Deltaproteobacteria bacterium]